MTGKDSEIEAGRSGSDDFLSPRTEPHEKAVPRLREFVFTARWGITQPRSSLLEGLSALYKTFDHKTAPRARRSLPHFTLSRWAHFYHDISPSISACCPEFGNEVATIETNLRATVH